MSDSRNEYDDLLSAPRAKASNSRGSELLGKYDRYLADEDSRRAQAHLLTAPQPDDAARSNKISRQVGVPAGLIDGQANEYELMLRQRAVAKASAADPRLSNFLADPRATAAAQDDVATLADISKGIQSFWGKKSDTRSWLQRARDYAVNLPSNVGSAVLSGAMQLSRGITDVATAAVDVGREIDVTAPVQRKVFGTTLFEQVHNGLSSFSKYQGEQIDAARPDYAGMSFVERSLLQGVESVPSSVAALGLAVSGAPSVGLGLLGATTGGTSYREGKEAGLGTFPALVYGTSQAAIEVGTERIPVMKWLHDTQVGTPFFKRLSKNLISEQIGEQAATALQDLNTWAAVDANKGKTFGDYLAERPAAAAATALAVTATVGATNTAMGIAERTAGHVARAAEARESAATLTGVMSTAEKSALRKRDPEHFRQFVEHMSEGSPAENVYLPVEAVDTFMQGENFKDEGGFFEGIAGQLEEARATGGDVVVPLADVATHLAGTAAWEALKDDARIHAGGWSVKESIEHGDATQEALAARGEEIASAVFEQAASEEPARQVFEEVRDQLRAAGFTADAATKQAQMFAASREAWGARLGQTALEYHRANPVEFRRGTTAAQAAGATRVMDQGADQFAPEAWQKARESGDRIVYLTPQQFLSVAARDEPRETSAKTVAEALDGGAQLSDLPELALRSGSDGRPIVDMHDGRHRARALAERGETLIPVRVAGDGNLAEVFPQGGGDALNLTGVSPEEYAARTRNPSAVKAKPQAKGMSDDDILAALFDQSPNPSAGFASRLPGYHAINIDGAAVEYTVSPDGRSIEVNRIEVPDDGTASRDDVITRLVEAAAENGQRVTDGARTYNQEARGQIALYPDRSVITLFENSDLSTLIHETGHLFLEELKRNATAANAPADVVADWQAIQTWFKDNKVPLAKGAIPREAHELFARGFERYAMEGKAPSSQLQAAFTAFRSWLLRIYQVVQNLRSPITPEVREVFGRMLATQDAIDSYSDEQNAKALTGIDKLMNDAEFDAYQKSVTKARTDAFDALLFRTMERIRVRRQREFNEASRAIKRDAAEAVLAEPRFRALRLLRTGKLDEQTGLDVKLDHDWLVERFGADAVDQLPQGTAIWRNGGTDADEIAAMTGFTSGVELAEALFAVQQEQSAMRANGDKRQLRSKLIDDAANAVIEAEGLRDPLTDGTLEEEAVAAIENERHGEVIASENRALARRTGTQATPYRLAREWARRKIVAGKVVDVASRSAMQRYARAAAKAARLAETAMLAQDIDEAFRQKQAQLLNHALLTEAKNAADEVDRITARLNKLAKRAAMKSVDQDYFDRVHELLERYNFRPVSQRWLDEVESFRDWAAGQSAKGFEVAVPERLNDDRQHYSRVSVEELLGLGDTVDSLMALGRHKQKLLDAKDERDFADVIKRMLGKMRELSVRKLPKTSVSDDSARRTVRQRIAGGIKISTIALDLDHQDPNGPMTNLLVKRASDASLVRTRLREKALQPIANRLAKLTGKQWKRLRELVTIPELSLVAGLSEDDPRLGQPLVLTRMELLGVALNTGNASNFEKMWRGERWNPQALRAVLDRELSAQDWQFVQAAWESVETLWPSIVATERQLSGVVPEKVDPTPIVTRHGTFAGGYWPVVYDSARSVSAAENEAKAADDMFGQRSGLATAKGHTVTRTKAIGPMVYSLERVLFSHIDKVITRVAYAQYARDVLRVMREPRIAAEIDLRLGREYRDEIQPWLADQINVHPDVKAGDWTQWLLRYARQGIVAVGMGLRFGTGVAQISGLMSSLGRLGGTQTHKLFYHVSKQVLSGVASMAQGKRSAIHEFVFERSEFMARRLHENTVEVERASKKLQGRHGWKDHVSAWMFWHIGMVDLHIVSIPTWITGYRNAIDKGMTEPQAVAYADSMVATSQGSGRQEHLARWQRSRSEGEKLFTMFYTPFNVIFNAQWEIARGVKRGDYTRAANLTFFFLMGQMLADALLSGDWPDDDDDDGMALNAAQWVARNFAFGLFSGIPVARDVAAFGERTLAGQYATFGGTPVGRIFEEMGRAGSDLYKVWNDDKDFDPKMVPGMANAVGTATHLPLGQPGQTIKFLWEYQRGDVQPQSIGDWYLGLTKGKMAEKKDQAK